MTARITGRVFGQVFEVNVPEQLLDSVLPRLPFGWEPTTDSPGATWTVVDHGDVFYDVEQNGEPIQRRRPWAAVPADVGGSIELWAAEHANGLVVIHAGSVAWDGRVIAIAGHTLTGKSMLVREFLRRGATYLSDEYIPLQNDGLALPYPRPLSVRPNGDGLSHQIEIATLGCDVADKPMPLGLVLEVRYDAAAGLDVRELSRAEVAMSLLRHCVPAQSRPVEALDHIHAAVGDATGLSGTRGEAHDAVSTFLARLS